MSEEVDRHRAETPEMMPAKSAAVQFGFFGGVQPLR
jgi:hypothetical protein